MSAGHAQALIFLLKCGLICAAAATADFKFARFSISSPIFSISTVQLPHKITAFVFVLRTTKSWWGFIHRCLPETHLWCLGWWCPTERLLSLRGHDPRVTLRNFAHETPVICCNPNAICFTPAMCKGSNIPNSSIWRKLINWCQGVKVKLGHQGPPTSASKAIRKTII